MRGAPVDPHARNQTRLEISIHLLVLYCGSPIPSCRFLARDPRCWLLTVIVKPLRGKIRFVQSYEKLEFSFALRGGSCT